MASNSDNSHGVPPSPIGTEGSCPSDVSGAAAGSNDNDCGSCEPTVPLPLPFANDGSFMEQFMKASNAGLISVPVGQTDTNSPSDGGRFDTISGDDFGPTAESESKTEESSKLTSEGKPKKSLLAAFSTKKKEVRSISTPIEFFVFFHANTISQVDTRLLLSVLF